MNKRPSRAWLPPVAVKAVAGTLLLVLVTMVLETSQLAAASASVADPMAQTAVMSRPDVLSAGVSARAQGSRVEVESLRTETSSTWINPDGTLTSEVHAAPVRFKDTSGRWQDIDLSLVKGTDGSVAPRSHAHDLELGTPTATAGGVFASATAGAGLEVEWVAPWKLPVPTVEDTKATYAEVQPGVDLVLDARRSGFEHDFVVKHRPVVAPMWRIPLRTKGLTAKPQTDGSIRFVDAKNVVRSVIPVAYMWDAVTDPASGLPANTARVNVTVEQQSPGHATLVITPDAAWFLDPARVFPVTVDPTYATGSAVPSFDTWVQSDVTTDQSASAELRVGSWDGGVTKTRSFLNFATAPFQGKQILGATLSLFESYSHTCTASTFLVKSAITASTATRWTNQPGTGGQYGSATAAKGFSSACPAGRVEVPITGLAQAWSEASYATGGLAVVAANENDSNGWKRFHSTEGAGDPFISITWNRRPTAPAVPTFASAVAYAPPGGASVLYTPYRKPWVQTKATDADGNTVRYLFEFHTSTAGTSASLVTNCGSTPGVPSGTTDGCTPTVELPDNTAIYVRAKTTDGFLESGWSEWQLVRVATQAPSTPTVSCPSPYVINSWQDTAPMGNVVCTITATGNGFSAPGYVRATVDGKPYPTNVEGGAAGQIKITPSSDPAVAKTTVTIPNDVEGLHRISVQAETPTGKLSAVTSYSFGWGGAAMTSPGVNPRVTTTGTLKIEATGPPRGSSTMPTASLRWRVSGYGTGNETVGWNITESPLTATDNGTAGISVTGLWDTRTATTDARLDANPTTPIIDPTTLNERLPVLLDVQVCLTYASSVQCTWSQTKNTVQRVPNAFGEGFPTAGAGPGQVALWTGEFNTRADDITVPGYAGDLSISRSHSTHAGEADAVNGVFGPGWHAHFDGAEAGAAGLQILDRSRLDGTIAMLDGTGTALVWASPNWARRTGGDLTVGNWVPADESTELDASQLTVSKTGTVTTISYIENDGTVTTYTASVGINSDAQFKVAAVTQAGIAAATTYSYDAAGRIYRILAPAPPGVTCPAAGALNPGCRALRFDYGASGPSSGRLLNAWLDIYNPEKVGGAGMDSIKVAEYVYDDKGRLQRSADPRSGLATDYGYNADNHLASLKPPGEVPFQFIYELHGNAERLVEVRRDRPAGDPAGGTASLTRVVYDVPLSGSGLPDMTSSAVARWGQKSPPAKAFAVFGADHPLAAAPAPEDWPYAELQYADADGRVVNTAKVGAGDWQYSATDYNDQGSPIRTLDERALREIIDNQIPAGSATDQLATLTVYNGNPAATGEASDGMLVTDTYGPARFVVRKDGGTAWARPHTRIDYDEFAPNSGVNPRTGMPYRLETTQTIASHDPGSGTDLEINSRTLTDYNATTSGDPDGWNLGLASNVITDLTPDGARADGDGDIVKFTRYDGEGRVIETRQPESYGADAGTVKTVYYTAAPNASFVNCGLKPQWVGLVCVTYPAAQPTSTQGQTSSLPSAYTSKYSYLLLPMLRVESSGSATRSVQTSYTSDGRIAGSTTVVDGLPGSSPLGAKQATYASSTGKAEKLTTTSASGESTSIEVGHDGWGRQVKYIADGDSPTITTYDAAGRPATITDSNGARVYTYDGMDALGRTERRGLPTKMQINAAGNTWMASAAYDAASLMVIQRLPGGITQSVDVDTAGEKAALRYSGQVSTFNEDGTTSTQADGAWLSWSAASDIAGRLKREWTPEGALVTGPPDDVAGDAIPYDRGYDYDPAGRLIQVRDRTAASTGTDVTDPNSIPECVTRSYEFDRNDNRLSKRTSPPAMDGGCSTNGGNQVTRSFDTADRPVSGANGVGRYEFDALGRATVIPASDSSSSAGGDIGLTYFDNDQVHSVAKDGTTTSYSLDAAGRRKTETSEGPDGNSETTFHYTDESDNPTWTSRAGTIERHAALLGQSASLQVNSDGTASVALANLHGDVVARVNLSSPESAGVGIDRWRSYDEYGAPRQDRKSVV